jgi:hypothetical protein
VDHENRFAKLVAHRLGSLTLANFRILRFIGENGAPGEVRTPDLLVRSQTLYPAELRARNKEILPHARAHHLRVGTSVGEKVRCGPAFL